MDLFTPVVSPNKFHPIFKLSLNPVYGPERQVMLNWAEGFVDRDNKFIREFQTTFESSFWELYIYAVLKEYGAIVNFSHHAPDFVVDVTTELCIEATIALPEKDGRPNYGWSIKDIPEDFSEFNRQSTLRICNSLSSKIRKYRESYSGLTHVKNKPFVIAITSFDRPLAHFASNRPIVTALYGEYFDEEMTISSQAKNIVHYPVDSVFKNLSTEVSLGYFLDDTFSEVSAVIYTSIATWGKVRALADNKNAHSIYQTFHVNEGSITPELRVSPKADYFEHLIDGLQIFHNPYAKHPINKDIFNHPRIAQLYVDHDELITICPDDFLLMRMISTMNMR